MGKSGRSIIDNTIRLLVKCAPSVHVRTMTSSATSCLRVGLVGAGWVTQHHLAAWQRQAPRARVVAIADPTEQRAEERASAFGIERVHRSAEQMLDAGGIDAIDIAAPRETHAALVRHA